MRILLSIKPEYAALVYSRAKLYEYRKSRPMGDRGKALLYETAPIRRVTGEADITGILEDSPLGIWEKTKDGSGIAYERFMEYFEEKTKAFAYRLENPIRYERPLMLSELGVRRAPESWQYLADCQLADG